MDLRFLDISSLVFDGRLANELMLAFEGVFTVLLYFLTDCLPFADYFRTLSVFSLYAGRFVLIVVKPLLRGSVAFRPPVESM